MASLDSGFQNQRWGFGCRKGVTKKVVDKTLNAWKHPAANKEYQQLNDAAQDRAEDSAKPYKNKLNKTADQINNAMTGGLY